MILATTHNIDGKTVLEYKGIVTGETIVGINVVRDIFAAVRDFFGGRSKSYEKELIKARETALTELEQKAKDLGADAVIGVDLDYETLGGGMLMVMASGTAVIFK